MPLPNKKKLVWAANLVLANIKKDKNDFNNNIASIADMNIHSPMVVDPPIEVEEATANTHCCQTDLSFFRTAEISTQTDEFSDKSKSITSINKINFLRSSFNLRFQVLVRCLIAVH